MYANLKIYSDGGSRGNPGYSASAFVVIREGKVIYKESKFLGVKTNNEAEYYGVLLALEWLNNNRNLLKEIKKINFYLDSELVVRQILGIYKTKVFNLKDLLEKSKSILKKLKVETNFFSVPREKNRIADLLVNIEIDENIG